MRRADVVFNPRQPVPRLCIVRHIAVQKGQRKRAHRLHLVRVIRAFVPKPAKQMIGILQDGQILAPRRCQIIRFGLSAPVLPQRPTIAGAGHCPHWAKHPVPGPMAQALLRAALPA